MFAAVLAVPKYAVSWIEPRELRLQSFTLSGTVCSARLGQFKLVEGPPAVILTGSGIQNKQNSLHAAGMIILFKSFLGILLLDPNFFFHHIAPQVYPSI